MFLQTQFSVFLVNKPGVLAAVTTALAKAKVNIIALTLMDSMEHGVLRIVCDNAGAARDVLGRCHDRWTETDVLVLELPNEPGAFAAVVAEGVFGDVGLLKWADDNWAIPVVGAGVMLMLFFWSGAL